MSQGPTVRTVVEIFLMGVGVGVGVAVCVHACEEVWNSRHAINCHTRLY